MEQICSLSSSTANTLMSTFASTTQHLHTDLPTSILSLLHTAKIYSCPLNNMGLNCTRPPIHKLFQKIPILFQSMAAEG